MTNGTGARPRVSVVMLTYNHEPFIRTSIGSVLAQELPGVELVVADDASTDGTQALVRELLSDTALSVQLVMRSENIGAQRNFADAWSRCRGEYIAILEGDDFWTDPAKLARQVTLMDSRPQVTVAFHRVDAVDTNGTPRRGSWPPDQAKTSFTLQDLAQENSIQTCSVLYRAGVVERLPGWFERLVMNDWPLHLLHAARGDIAYLPEPMAAYRFHEGGIWSGRPAGRRLLESARTLLVVADRSNPLPSVRRRLRRSARRFEGLALGACMKTRDRAGAAEALRLLMTQRPTDRPLELTA